MWRKDKMWKKLNSRKNVKYQPYVYISQWQITHITCSLSRPDLNQNWENLDSNEMIHTYIENYACCYVAIMNLAYHKGCFIFLSDYICYRATTHFSPIPLWRTSQFLFGWIRNIAVPLLIMKHSGGSVMLWGCFPAAGTRWLIMLEEKMHWSNHKARHEENFPKSIQENAGQCWRGT